MYHVSVFLFVQNKWLFISFQICFLPLSGLWGWSLGSGGVMVDKLLEQMAREHANSKQKDPTRSLSHDTANYCTTPLLTTSSSRTRLRALTGNSVLYDSASSAEATVPVYMTQHSKHNTQRCIQVTTSCLQASSVATHTHTHEKVHLANRK